jgi:hypothetical protein
MLPTEKTSPKASLSDLTVLVYGPTKFGKCLKGDTVLIHAGSAWPVTVRDLVDRRDGLVLTMRDAGVIAAQRPSAYVAHEPEQLFRLTTHTGRTIEATANHPFLTREGWTPLSELSLGDGVAIVAEYPQLFGRGDADAELLKLLAYLTANGTSGDGSTPAMTDPDVRRDFAAAVDAKGDMFVEIIDDDGMHLRVGGKGGARSNALSYLHLVGVLGVCGPDKHIPDFVFGLRKEKLRLFLNRLFTCDGAIDPSGRILYHSTSVRLLRQVQHLLTRFGIVSVLEDRSGQETLAGAELSIASKADVLRCIDEIGFLGDKAVQAERVRASLYDVREVETELDRLGPVLFDPVVSIEATDIAPVFDLTIDGSHNFIANDFVVHNSTWCSNADGALFLATEAGLNSLEVYQEPIGTWDELLVTAKEIAEGKHGFRTVIIDTVDNAYRMCVEHVCQKLKIEHESDLGYGKGYALVNNEFHRVLNKLALLPYGLFLVSHAQDKELETRTGKLTRVVPTLPDKARKIVLGMVDIILFCDLEPTTGADGKPAYRRVIRSKPSTTYEAGDRTGRLPATIDFDFAAFTAAFAQGSPRPVAAAPASPAPTNTTPATPPPANTKPTTASGTTASKPRSAATVRR